MSRIIAGRLVSDAAGINRLIVHLLTHWTPPRAEIRIDTLPLVVVQRAPASRRAAFRSLQLRAGCNAGSHRQCWRE